MERDKSLDFVKFVYIAMMVIYHCLISANYDHSFQIDINRYLAYVSGSFPFMTGYFISAHYFESLKNRQGSMCTRLLFRGMKLILIYIILNIIFIYAVNDFIDINVITKSDNPIISILTGNPTKVIYDVLYSIGVILIFGAFLSAIQFRISSQTNKYTLAILVCLISTIIYLDESILIASGVMGIITGLSPIRDYLDRIYHKKMIVIASYLFGLIAVILLSSVKKELIIYIAGVTTLFFSLKHSYKYIKTYVDKSELIDLLSKYSLFIYLFHVVILVITTKSLLKISPSIDPVLLFIILIALITYSSILITKRIEIEHANKTRISKIYRSIFN